MFKNYFKITETQDIIIFQSSTFEEATALKAFTKALELEFEIKEEPYNPEFANKISESEKEITQGRTKKVKKADLKRYVVF